MKVITPFQSLPPGYTPAYRSQAPLLPGGGEAPGEYPPRIPVGPLLSAPVHTLTGTRGQTIHIHRHAYRTTHPDDTAWTAHGYAWRCHTCHTVGGAHDQYTPTLRSAERHHCTREGENTR